MRESVSLFRPGWLLLGIAALFAFRGVAAAEQVGVAKDLADKWNKQDKNYPEYISGTKKVEDKKAAEECAVAFSQYFIYRITHPTPPSAVQSKFAELLGRGEKRRESNIAFLNILGPKMVESMKEVLRAQDPKKDATVIVNAAMMLPTMAKLKQHDVGAYLLELVNGKDTHVAVRLYALKALKEYTPITPQPAAVDLKDANENAKRERDRKFADPLVSYVEKPLDVKGLSNGEVEGLRFLRREAIISLAHAGAPAVLAIPEKVGKKKTPDGMVAPTLLKVLAGDLQPPPSTQERVEAAIGLLNMKYENMPEYNPDLATYLVGRMLVDFATEYNKDAINFTGFKSAAFIPWKADARKLRDAIIENAKKNPDSKMAKELKMHAEAKDSLLHYVIDYKTPNVNQLTDDVKNRRKQLKDGKVFKTLKAPEIRLDAGGGGD